MTVSIAVAISSAVVALVGGLATALATIRAVRRDLYKSAQQTLIDRRITLYPALWAITADLERPGADVGACTTRYRDWYWADGGGMYLTQHSRQAYLAADKLLSTLPDAAAGEALSTLRSRMKEDIRAHRRKDDTAAVLDDSRLAQ